MEISSLTSPKIELSPTVVEFFRNNKFIFFLTPQLRKCPPHNETYLAITAQQSNSQEYEVAMNEWESYVSQSRSRLVISHLTSIASKTNNLVMLSNIITQISAHIELIQRGRPALYARLFSVEPLDARLIAESILFPSIHDNIRKENFGFKLEMLFPSFIKTQIISDWKFCRKATSQYFITFLEFFPHLQTVSLSDCRYLDFNALRILSDSSSRLQKLTVTSSEIFTKVLDEENKIFPLFPELVSLEVYHVHKVSHWFFVWLSEQPKLTHITLVDVTTTIFSETPFFNCVPPFIKTLGQRVIHLNLSKTPINKKAFKLYIKEFKALKELHLGQTGFDPSRFFIYHFAQQSSFPHLQILVLNNQVSDETIQKLRTLRPYMVILKDQTPSPLVHLEEPSKDIILRRAMTPPPDEWGEPALELTEYYKRARTDTQPV